RIRLFADLYKESLYHGQAERKHYYNSRNELDVVGRQSRKNDELVYYVIYNAADYHRKQGYGKTALGRNERFAYYNRRKTDDDGTGAQRNGGGAHILRNERAGERDERVGNHKRDYL